MTIPEPNPNSPTWPVVLAFAKLMESKLALNRHKGDREGWLKYYPEALLDRVRDETGECMDEVLMEHPENTALEAADIANFAMMVADSATNGQLLTLGIPSATTISPTTSQTDAAPRSEEGQHQATGPSDKTSAESERSTSPGSTDSTPSPCVTTAMEPDGPAKSSPGFSRIPVEEWDAAVGDRKRQ